MPSEETNEKIINDMYLMIRDLLEFPFPTICRHDVCLRLLMIIERAGQTLDIDLAKYICSATTIYDDGMNGDEKSLKRMDKLKLGKKV